MSQIIFILIIILGVLQSGFWAQLIVFDKMFSLEKNMNKVFRPRVKNSPFFAALLFLCVAFISIIFP